MSLNEDDTFRNFSKVEALGETFGNRYKIIKQLGRGGWGITYLAQDLENPSNSQCVIKEIKCSEQLTQTENETYFYREVAALKILGRHDQIPYYIDSFTMNGKFYIVQEFVSGKLLSTQIQRGKTWRERKVRELLIDILEVLEFIHCHNTVHRDLKPNNIIRRDDGEISIIDYGTVKEIYTLNHTNSGNFQSILIGSESYIAPERYIFPKSNGIDEHPRIDIYSVGIIGLQAITGLTPQELYIDPISGERLWSEVVKVTPKMKSILNKMSHQNPQARYQNVNEVLRDLYDLEYSKNSLGNSNQLNSFVPSAFKLNRFQFPYWKLSFIGFIVLFISLWQKEPLSNNAIKNILVKSIPSPEITINIRDKISIGEKILNSDTQQYTLKKQAIKLYKTRNYEAAAQQFIKYWNRGNQDPETLIYLNNTLIELTEQDYKTIAVVVPFTDSTYVKINNLNDIANELLRGIAKAQEEANLGLFKHNLLSDNKLPDLEILKQQIGQGKKLKIILAADDNNHHQAQEVAKKLVNLENVLGVVGHYTSGVTIQTMEIYNKAKIPLISPTSSAETLIDYENTNPFFFRTIPSVEANAEALANYLINQVNHQKAAIFYNPNPQSFSYSFWQEFKKRFEDKGGEVILEYDNFNQNNFSAAKAIRTLEKEPKIAIVLLPDGQVTNSFNNAIEIIRLNVGKNWIVGAETLYNPKTLDIGSPQLFEKFAVAIPWHSSNSPNSKFVEESQKLWRGNINYRTALAYDATHAFIKAIELAQQKDSKTITPTVIQSILSHDNFSTQGASGTIEFTPHGNRKNHNMELVTIIECKTKKFVSVSQKQCLN